MAEKDYNYLIGETDAAVWADAFVELNPSADWGTMVGWFANAIEAGKMNG